MNLYNIAHAFEKTKIKGWPFIYFAIDIHDVIFKGTYEKNNDSKQFYPWAKEVLQNLSLHPRVKLIIYSAGHRGPTEDVVKWLKENHIDIFAINSNPDHAGTPLCDFSTKFYFDILLEDKAGFEGWKDWFLIMKELQRIDEWIPAYKDDGVIITVYGSDNIPVYANRGPSSYEYMKLHRELRCDWNCPVCQFEVSKSPIIVKSNGKTNLT